MNDHQTAIAEQITKLLSHFATAAEPLAVRRAIARDWLEDLAEFTVAQVEWACREWRRNQSIRPAIADIRRLATQAQQNDADKSALEDQRRQGLDEDTIETWDKPEYHGDYRSPQQRRNDAIERMIERYSRGQAWREGKLDEYDARHHPERLAERQRRAAREAMNQPYSSADRSIGDVLQQMGITAHATSPAE